MKHRLEYCVEVLDVKVARLQQLLDHLLIRMELELRSRHSLSELDRQQDRQNRARGTA